MTTERDVTRIVRSWLEDGVTTLPDRVLDQVLDQLPATPQRRPMWRARRIASMNNFAKLGVAAAVVAAAVVGLTVLPSNAPGPGASSEPTPSPTASPRIVPESGPLAPGSWSFTDIAPFAITFTIPAEGWQKNVVPGVIWTDSSEARFGVGLFEDDLYADPCSWQAGTIEPPVGPTVDDLATAFANLPGMDATTPATVSVDGYQGRFVELTAPTDQSACDGEGMRLAGEGPLEPGRHRFWIVDVDGTRVVVSAVDRPAANDSERNELQEIIDSIRFE
jgi:hypothetical protein